jgi:tryptophan halogenase
MQKTLSSLCIVGGGTAGWMAASLLSPILRGTHISITVVESPDIPTVGVGESTVPSIIDFIHTCQIDLREFIQHCSATFKLGIRFDDWFEKGEHYFHPFGRVGKEVNGFEFYQAWLKTKTNGANSEWLDFSPNAEMAKNERFTPKPNQPQNWVHASHAHALHFDAIKVADYLRTRCLKQGVKRIEATVEAVNLNDQGFINTLNLDNNTSVHSDFFVDCTGAQGLLIGQALDVEYHDWSHLLPCNRAVAVQTEQTQPPVPYTVAKAQESGWSWHIPLQHRMGNGYVYCSQFCSDQQAIETLTQNISGKLLGTPRIIPFKTGRRSKIWHKNCLALGLSAGFLEPLESTAIHLVYKTLVNFIKYFPDGDYDPITEHSFNQAVIADYEEIRDFIILHYATAGRKDTPFWQWCQQIEMPANLKERLKMFRNRGELPTQATQLFSNDSWYSILEGMHIRPKKYHPLMDAFHAESLTNTLNNNLKNVRDIVNTMPKHHDFIQTHCPAQKVQS